MNIRIDQYEKAKKQLEKLVKVQNIVKAWEAALKGFKVPEGQSVVEVQIKDGRTRYITEGTADAKKTG